MRPANDGTVRDTKDLAGAVLTFGAPAWREFAARLKRAHAPDAAQVGTPSADGRFRGNAENDSHSHQVIRLQPLRQSAGTTAIYPERAVASVASTDVTAEGVAPSARLA